MQGILFYKMLFFYLLSLINIFWIIKRVFQEFEKDFEHNAKSDGQHVQPD